MFLLLLTCLAAGLLAGALLTEDRILVPYWRSMPPDQFLALHHTLGPALYRYFAPLTIAGTLLPLLALGYTLFHDQYGHHYWLKSAICALILLGLYFGFFRRANASFASGDDPNVAQVTLAQWARLHTLRTIVATIGFVCTILGYASA